MSLERILTGLVVVLAAIALALMGVLQWMKASGRASALQSGRSAPSLASQWSNPNGLPIPPGVVGGPYQKWPISFPKMLPGFFMLEDQAPALALTRAQARELLPVVEEMARNWETVHSVEIKIKERLAPPQRAWITKMKHQVEMSTLIRKVMARAGPLTPGENASVKATLRICQERMPHPLPAALAAAADQERHRELAPREYEQKIGEEWLTVFDECTSFALIEDEAPELRVTPQQAVYIYAILQEVITPLKVVSFDEQRLRRYVTRAQIEFVQDHMDLLYKYRTSQIKPKGTHGLSFPGNEAEGDAAKYHDPLYYETVRFLKRKLAKS